MAAPDAEDDLVMSELKKLASSRCSSCDFSTDRAAFSASKCALADEAGAGELRGVRGGASDDAAEARGEPSGAAAAAEAAAAGGECAAMGAPLADGDGALATPSEGYCAYRSTRDGVNSCKLGTTKQQHTQQITNQQTLSLSKNARSSSATTSRDALSAAVADTVAGVVGVASATVAASVTPPTTSSYTAFAQRSASP